MRVLNLADNEIVEIGPLAGLTALADLSLSNNRIADLSPLEKMTELIYLKLEGNRITDIDPLASLPVLEGVRLDDNQIEDLSALVANTDFGSGNWVTVRGNPLSEKARERQIPTLEARGVQVYF